MPGYSEDNKRIARNTLMLYLRMFVVMAISLYTSRVVLRTLGVDDYGIYNVVGGFVAMLAYLNSVFVSATQRFISFTLGEGNKEKLRRVFLTSVSVHLVIAGFILIVAETFGLWFVNAKLQIAPDRMVAANWVYQCSVFSLLATVINIPYKSSIISHEHMHFYAVIGIVEVVLKLAIVFMLLWLPGDKLIIYALLHFAISLFVPFWSMIYCRRFEECKLGFGIDRPLFKEMFSYSGWVLVGGLGFSFKDHFSNIIMNLFLGTAINAARGVATQVNGIVMSFAENFLTSLSPQITKQYASGNLERCHELVVTGARLAFFLMSLVAIPLIINIDYVLTLWLGVVPDYTSIFIIITLISSTFHATSKTLTVSLQATGNIKLFQIGVAIIMLSELPIAYLLLKLEYPPYYAMLPAILTSIVAVIFRGFIYKRQVPSFDFNHYCVELFVKCLPLMVGCFIISYFINRLFSINFGTFIVSTLICLLIIVVTIYFIGLNKREKNLVQQLVLSKFHKK